MENPVVKDTNEEDHRINLIKQKKGLRKKTDLSKKIIGRMLSQKAHGEKTSKKGSQERSQQEARKGKR